MTNGYKTLVVGISGPSSCGKTTLARLLRDIWPKTFILHEDDFYWPDSQIPIKDDVQDWDCLEAVDLRKLHSALEYIKQNGSPPPDLHSKEDQNSVGDCNVDKAVVDRLQNVAADTSDRKPVNIALIDGFLLYAQSMHNIRDQLDLKLFLRTDYETAKSRRNARSGYVTIEGFWQDPPGRWVAASAIDMAHFRFPTKPLTKS